MRQTVRLLLLALAFCLVCAPRAPRADVRVPSLVGDNMVLQRGARARLWGTARPGERVTVRLAGRAARATADAEGRWQTFLGPLEAGGPFELTVEGSNRLVFKNVLVGEVWVCSGQSNMEWPLSRAAGGAEDAARGAREEIRLFTVEKRTSAAPLADVRGRWVVATREEALRFSAVGFYFGGALHERLRVPVGLINASWGGTPAEAWTSREALAASPKLRPILERYERGLGNLPELRREYARRLAEWERAYLPPAAKDEGNKGEPRGYADPAHNASAWPRMNLPQLWENAGLNVDGVVWFRLEVNLPARLAGRDLTLSLGAIDDHDTTYFNGARVGATGAETPNAYEAPRRYRVPGPLVRAGRNVVAVRVFDITGGGGLSGPAGAMWLSPGGERDANALALDGAWAYQTEAVTPSRQVDYSRHPGPQPGPDNPYNPAVLYNAMLAPLMPFAVRGAVWYQGESNAGRAYQYRTLFPAMIRDWRRAWGRSDFPFYFVQLANWKARPQDSIDSEWAELREAQLMTMRALPRTGMAVAIDIGDPSDIHPRNKRDVGLRLARWALSDTYRLKVEPSGPLYSSHTVEGARVRLRFTHARGLKTSDGRAPLAFFVAGPDRKFHPADARLEGDTVVVWSREVPRPVAVRYAWADSPAVNLYNAEDLPASPFRTDAWPALTDGRD